MKADELEQRLKNALIYGTSHPEAYMTKADELWEKYVGNGVMITRDDFLAALKEYGELVKAGAVKVCEKKVIEYEDDNIDSSIASAFCAAAIKDMELP